MPLAVISDIHNHVQNLRRILAVLASRKPSSLVCCGDITRPQTLEELLAFEGPVWFCLGNCDQEYSRELLDLSKIHYPLHGFRHQGVMELNQGDHIAFCHSPSTARQLAQSGLYRAVFYGHTHKRHMEIIPQHLTLLANPGDVEGRSGKPTALLWDPASGATEFIEA